MVDLSKAQAGWTAHFRCGGSAEVAHVKLKDGAAYQYGIVLKDNSIARAEMKDPVGFYQDCGSLKGTSVNHPFDIIRLEPPAFDWKDVKPGMAWFYPKANFRGGALAYFVGMCPVNKGHGVFSSDGYGLWIFNEEDIAAMERRLLHDIKVQS